MKKRLIKRKNIKIISIFLIFSIVLFIHKKGFSANTPVNESTWKKLTSYIQQVNVELIANDCRDSGALQGFTVTHKHIVFTSKWIDESVDPNGNSYIYFMDKETKQVDDSLTIVVPHSPYEEESIYGHMNDMTYNPNTGEIFIPFKDAGDNNIAKVAIIKYDDKIAGTVNTNITIVKQPKGILDYNASGGGISYNENYGYIFRVSNDWICIAQRSGEGFADEVRWIKLYENTDTIASFFYTTPQGLFSKGEYIYIPRWEAGYSNGHQNYYYDSNEMGSNIIVVFKINPDLNSVTFVKTLYIPSKVTKYILDKQERVTEIETGCFDPITGEIYLGYNITRKGQETLKAKLFFNLNTGWQKIEESWYYFDNYGIPIYDWHEIYDITINQYIYDNDIIRKVPISTKVGAFKNNIAYGNNYSIKVVDKEGNELDEIANIKTGDKLQIKYNSENEIIKEFSIAVIGDTNGDGQANIADILAINKHRLNKEKLTGAYLAAGDVDDDNLVDVKDILKINKYRLGKISTL